MFWLRQALCWETDAIKAVKIITSEVVVSQVRVAVIGPAANFPLSQEGK